MNVHLKRTLILCLMLFCLLAITVVGISASSTGDYNTDAEAVAAGYVYRVGDTEGATATYYMSEELSDTVTAASGAVIVDLVNTTDATEKTVTVGSTTAQVLTSAADKVAVDLGAVAKIGDVYYTTLNDAINAISAEGQTIYMIADFTQTNSIGGYDKKPTHAAAAKYSFTLSSADPENIILTVGAGQFFDLGDGSKVVPTLKDIKINVQSNMLGWFNNVSVVIDEGTYVYGAGNATYGIIYGANAANITIKSGATVDITSANYIVVATGNTKLNIEGGTFTKNSHGMNLMHLNGAGVEMTISDGHFSIGYTSSTAELFRITEAKCVTLSGGTFENKGSGSFVYYTTAGKTGTLKVENTFTLPSVPFTFHNAVTFADDATAVNLGYVARVGETLSSSNYYKTLNNAAAAVTASNNTIVLLTNYTQPGAITDPVASFTLTSIDKDNITLTLSTGWLIDIGNNTGKTTTFKNIKINLGANNLGYFRDPVIIDEGTHIYGTGRSKEGMIYAVNAYGKITVKAGAKIEALSGANSAFVLTDGATLTVEGGEFMHAGSGHIINVDAGCSTAISGGTFSHTGNGAILNNVSAVTGGTFTHSGSGHIINVDAGCSTAISGGTFTHTGTGDIINQLSSTTGGVTIQSGTFTYNGTKTAEGKGGFMIQARGVFTVTGGTFVANSGNTMVELSGTATISGTASFTQNNAALLFNVWGGKTTIKGGTFTSTAAGAMIEGGAELVIENGTFKHTGRQALLNVKAAVTVKGGNFTNETSWYVFSVTAGKTLTIEDGTFTSKGSDSLISNSGTVIIKSGTFDHTASGHMIQNSGTLTISGGEFTNKGNRLVQGNANSTLTITGGTFDHYGAHGFCINNADATASFTGGTFNHYGANEGILANNSSANITIGDSFTANSYSSAAMISRMAGTITIDGGTFTGSAAGPLVTGAATIKNGTFTHTGSGNIINVTSANTTVQGGTFTHSGSGYVVYVNSANLAVSGNTVMTHEGTGASYIYYRNGGNCAVTFVGSNVQLIAKGNNYIFEQGYSHSDPGFEYNGAKYTGVYVEGAYLSTERANGAICYTEQNPYMTFVNVKMDSDSAAGLAGIPVRISSTVGEGYYNKFNVAMSAAANNSTIYVVGDFTSSAENSTGAKTLHVTGVKLSNGNYPTITHTSAALFNVQGGGNLTVTNLNVNSTTGNVFYVTGTATLGEDLVITHSGSGHIIATVGSATIAGATITNNATGDSRVVAMNAGSSLTITSGTITNASDYLICQNNANTTVNISGGSLTSSAGVIFRMIGANTVTTISGGTFTQNGTKQLLDSYSGHTLNISGGTFTNGGSSYLASLRGTVNISGGSFINNNNSDLAELSGTVTISGTASFDQNGNNRVFNVWGGNTTIKGGTFAMTANANMIASGATLTVESGTFTHTGSGNIIHVTSATTTVQGGTFKHSGSGAIVHITAGKNTISGATMTHTGSGSVINVYNDSVNTITSGTFKQEGTGNLIWVYDGGAEVTISGGSFAIDNVGNANSVVRIQSSKSVTITGGSFSHNGSGFVLWNNASVSVKGNNQDVILIANGTSYLVFQGYLADIENAYIEMASTAKYADNDFEYVHYVNVKFANDATAVKCYARYRLGDMTTVTVGGVQKNVGVYYTGIPDVFGAVQNNGTVYLLRNVDGRFHTVAKINQAVATDISGKNVTLDGQGYTITDSDATAYLFNVKANSAITFSDVTIVTNGKVIQVDSTNATATIGEGAAIIGRSVGTDTMVQMWGPSNFIIAEGGTFTVESQSSAMHLYAIYTNGSFAGKIEIAGKLEYKGFTAAGKTLMPVYVAASNSATQTSTLLVSGEIINNAICGSAAGIGMGTNGCQINVTGSVTLGGSASSQSAVINLGTKWNGKLTVAGALINNDTGANAMASAIFYNQSAKNSTAAMIYINGGARLTLNSVNSTHTTVFRVNCNVDADATRGDATKGIIITTKGNSGTKVFNCPTLNPDFLTFKNVAFDIQKGIVASAVTTLTNCAFTSDAKAITYKTAMVSMNAETIVLDGITFQTGYYDTLAYAVGCLPEGDSATIYVLANHTATPFSLANRNVTITSGNGSIFTVTTGTGAGNFINLNGNAKLTLENVTLNLSRYGFRFSNGTNNHVVLNSGATMTLGNTEGTWIIRADTANSSITVNDGALLEVTSTTQAANVIYTTVAGVTTTINGGTFKNASTGHILRLENSAVTEVKGGTFKHTGTGYVVYVNSANIAVSGNTVMKHEGAGSSYLYYRQGGNCTVTFVGSNVQLIAKGNNYIFEQGYSSEGFAYNGTTYTGIYVEGAYLSTERADGAICYTEQYPYMNFVNVKFDSDQAAGLAGIPYRVDNRTVKITVEGVEKTVYTSYCSSFTDILANVADGSTIRLMSDITLNGEIDLLKTFTILGIKKADGTYPTIKHGNTSWLFEIKGNVTFKNVNFTTTGHLFYVSGSVTTENVSITADGKNGNLINHTGAVTLKDTNVTVLSNDNNVFRVSDAKAVLTIEGNSKIVNKGGNGLIYQPSGSVVINGGRFENLSKAPMIQTETGSITITQGYFLHEGKTGNSYILYLTGSKDINVSVKGKDVIFDTNLSPFNSGNAAVAVTVEDASFITHAPLFTNNTYKSRNLINLTLKDDATAALNGAIIRVGDGKLSTGSYTHNYTYGYFTDLATAVAAAKSGETIYFIADVTITPTEVVVNNKDLTFAGGSDDITVTVADTNQWLFNIKNGSDVTVTNLTIFANGHVFYMGGTTDASNPTSLVIAEDVLVYGTTANAQQMIMGAGKYFNLTINGKVGFGKNDGTTENTQCTANTYLIQIDDNAWEGTITVNGELWSLVTKKSADWHTIFRLKAVNGKLYINEGAKITQSLASHAGYAGVNGVIWNDGITVIDGATIVTNAGLLYIEPDSGKTPVVKVSNSDITVGTALNTSATTALNYADDATAALFGVPFRVGEETADVHGFTCYTGYFTDLAAAVASVKAETPTTIYVMNDYSTNATIVLNGKYEVTLRGLDGNCHTITETGSWLFNVKGGAKLTIADVNFKSNNNLFRVDAGNNNSYLTLDGNMDITMTGAIGSGDTIDAWGAAYIVIGEGVNLTTKGAITTAQVHLVHACGSFKGQIDIYGKITNSISGAFNQKVVRSSSASGGVINVHESAVLTNDCVAPQNSTEVSVLYNYATACPTVFNVYGKLVHTAPYGSLVYLCNGASLNIYEGAELVRDGGVNNNYGIYTYGGSSINIYGGSFTNLGKGDILYANAGTANVYGGYFEACNGSTVTVTSSATLNVYGGTFNYVGDSGTVFTNSGNLNVYGGAFRSVSTDAPIFTGLAGTTKLDAYVANGAGSLITNVGAGASTANHSNKLGQSFKNVITATAGAAPVIKDGQLVLRFKATVDKSAYAYLSNLAGSNGITFGMLVIPTADLAGDHLFTHNSLAEGTYLDIVATDDNITVEDDGCVTVRLELAEFDNTTKYSVVFYAKYQPVHGVDVYTYSNYTAGANSRSAEQIARMALNDTSTTPSASKYPYEVMTGIYSPYTVEEYQLLQTYCTNATLPTLDIYIVAGGSTAAGTAPFNTALVKDYPVGNANIFYSGITSALDYNSNKYVSAGNGVAFGQGVSVSTYGPEIGLANALSAYYNEETGKYAAIIKYAADDLSINSTYTYYDYLMETVQRDLEQYTDMGYAVNVVGMYWQQGEADYNDSYAVSAYKDRFAALVADMRADLTSIVKTVTGNALVNLEAMPVVVGEIGISYNVADKTAALAFVEMQQSLLAIDNVALINSSVFTCADDVFTDIEDMLLAGEMVVANLLNMGNSSLNLGDTVVEVPVAEPMVEVDGVAMRSVIAALVNAPAGSTVKLLKDIVLYEALALNGLDFTLDGNGHTIISKTEGATLTVNNSLVTLKDVVVENQLDNDNAYAIELGADAHLTVTGATAISAYSTAIKLNAENSSVTIEGGFFATRAGSANNAIIDTTSANVRINGGSFVAGGNAACVRVGVSAPEKLVVNVTGGTFVADGYAFVNDSYYAIMVISPDADVTGGIYNAGFGNETAA